MRSGGFGVVTQIANLTLEIWFALCEPAVMSKRAKPILTAKALREIGVSKGHASDLINGKRKPSLELAVKIEAQFGVPASRWVEAQATKAA